MSPKPGRRRGKAKSRARKPVAIPQASGTAAAAASPQGQAAAVPARPVQTTFRGAPKAVARLDYVKGDLKRMAVTAGAIVVVIVVLAVVFK